jgi:hypothetical protein
MKSKVVRQTQGGHERFIIHIPRGVGQIAGKLGWVEWVYGDRLHMELMVHTHEPNAPDRMITKVTGAERNQRTTVPKSLVDLLNLGGATFTWQIRSDRVYILTIIRRKGVVEE